MATPDRHVGKHLSRRDFLKLAGLTSAASLLLFGCGPQPEATPGVEFPQGLDTESSDLARTIEARMLQIQHDGKLRPELLPLAYLGDWLNDLKPDAQICVRVTSRQNLKGNPIVPENFFTPDGFYFRISWTKDPDPLLTDTVLQSYLQEALLARELAHAFRDISSFHEIKKNTDSVPEFFQEYAKTLTPEMMEQSGRYINWIEGLYFRQLYQENQAVKTIYRVNPDKTALDEIAVIEWLVANGKNWNSVEYRWFDQRCRFTIAQLQRELDLKYGKKQTVGFPFLTVRDAEIAPEFIAFLKSPDGGKVRYHIPKRIDNTDNNEDTENDIIKIGDDGKAYWANRNLFESNQDINDSFHHLEKQTRIPINDVPLFSGVAKVDVVVA